MRVYRQGKERERSHLISGWTTSVGPVYTLMHRAGGPRSAISSWASVMQVFLITALLVGSWSFFPRFLDSSCCGEPSCTCGRLGSPPWEVQASCSFFLFASVCLVSSLFVCRRSSVLKLELPVAIRVTSIFSHWGLDSTLLMVSWWTESLHFNAVRCIIYLRLGCVCVYWLRSLSLPSDYEDTLYFLPKLLVLLSTFRSGQSLPGTDFYICHEEESSSFFCPRGYPVVSAHFVAKTVLSSVSYCGRA